MNNNFNIRPRLLLHICCAPCSTHPIQQLKSDFLITAFFCNPNIYPPDEHQFRLEEARQYLDRERIELIAPAYHRKEWLDTVRDYGPEPEGGYRCALCFAYRLRKTAEIAVERGIDTFTTTLTIGPNKPGRVIFPIGIRVAETYGLKFLDIDFKKKDGFKHSCILSREQGMYRQDYCGCEYSYRDRNIRVARR